MATLLLCLAGPQQSWGTRSRFSDRDTELFPSKSGVIGLLCAALGLPRRAPLDDLAALTFGARADLPGRLETDYHVTQDIPTADAPVGQPVPEGKRRTLPSRRHYLADAVFLAGFEGRDETLLRQIHSALLRPVWPLFLGRKGFPPGVPVYLHDGFRNEPLHAALSRYDWLPLGPLFSFAGTPPDKLWVELEHPSGLPRQDLPLGNFEDRRFGIRRVVQQEVDRPRKEVMP